MFCLLLLSYCFLITRPNSFAKLDTSSYYHRSRLVRLLIFYGLLVFKYDFKAIIILKTERLYQLLLSV